MNKNSKISNSETRILLLGSTGMLGHTLRPFLDFHGYNVITHGRSNHAQHQVDITDLAEANKLLDTVKPDIVINLVGLTNVDFCETEKNKAYLTNIKAVENIAAWIKNAKVSSHLIQISTDQVYDGHDLHAEDHVTLTNYYAFSKYAGELAAASVSSTIIRTNFFGRSHCEKRESLTDWLYDSLSNDKEIKVFDDIFFNPVSMDALASIIKLVVQKKPKGIFNVGSALGMSKADFAFSFADELNLSTARMLRTSSDQVTFLKTYRPKDMRMDCRRIESELGIKLPGLHDEIKRVACEYNK